MFLTFIKLKRQQGKTATKKMDERATIAICMITVGAIGGALLGKLRKKGFLSSLFWGLWLNVFGWGIILLGDDEPISDQKSEKRAKLTKIARIIIGSFLTISPIAALINIFTTPIPAWENARHIFFSVLALVAIDILGINVLLKGIKKGNHSIDVNKDNPFAPIVKCTNHLCGKEISSNFDRCPFCGTPVIKPIEDSCKKE
jgi:hypothetical protein